MSNSTEFPKLLTVGEVADVLRVPKARAYDLFRAGAIRSVRIGRQVRVSQSDLQEFLRNGGHVLPGGWRREAHLEAN